MAGEHTPITPLGGVKAFACRQCGGQVQLLAPGQTLSAACSHCGAVADLTDENFRIISASRPLREKPLIQIGLKAEFEGAVWQLIGYMVRAVDGMDYQWEEYLFFNPYFGYRFLVQNYGHWTWLKMVNNIPAVAWDATAPVYEGHQFRKFSAGTVKVVEVLGEFFWKVHREDKAITKDFVAEPFMLSMEAENGGIVCSFGVYLEPKVVQTTFAIAPERMPSRQGIGANQPNPYKNALKKIVPITLIAICLAVALQILFVSMAAKKDVYTANFGFPYPSDTASAPFEVPGGMNNVEISIEAPELYNHWVEVSGNLHEINTNLNIDFTIPVEYYAGVESGESWTEGSRSETLHLNEIPGGKYELMLSVLSDQMSGPVVIKVQRGATVWSNLLIVLGFLLIYPVYLMVRSSGFEKLRNENAD